MNVMECGVDGAGGGGCLDSTAEGGLSRAVGGWGVGTGTWTCEWSAGVEGGC